MKILAVDTSSPDIFLAVCEYSDRWESSKTSFSPVARDKDNWIELCILEFMGDSALNDFDGFAAGSGPGSFTSLRISFTYLKTLAILWEKIFLTFSSSLFYHKYFCEPDEILLIRQNRSMLCAFDPETKIPSNKAQSLEDWMREIPQNRHGKLRIWNPYSEIPDNGLQLVSSKKITNPPVIPDFPQPDFMKSHRKELLQELPLYGHDIITHRKI
ncbi:MAG: hypothetical protein OEV66_10835 [Spirochaetia bacterium]|nr:hypothetical protein [Spirochaetia bacterium]